MRSALDEAEVIITEIAAALSPLQFADQEKRFFEAASAALQQSFNVSFTLLFRIFYWNLLLKTVFFLSKLIVQIRQPLVG